MSESARRTRRSPKAKPKPEFTKAELARIDRARKILDGDAEPTYEAIKEAVSQFFVSGLMYRFDLKVEVDRDGNYIEQTWTAHGHVRAAAQLAFAEPIRIPGCRFAACATEGRRDEARSWGLNVALVISGRVVRI